MDCIDLEECSDCDMSIPGDSASEAQTPGVNWDTFFDWYLQNVQCCKERCNDELNAFADCKDCGVPPSPTPCPTPQTTPSPTPPPVCTACPTPRLTPSPTFEATPEPTGSIRGIVFEDRNSTGNQNPGKPGIGDVKVVITESSGDSQTVTTGRNGMYMTVIPAGSAIIDINESTLPSSAEQTAGENPTEVEVPDGGTVTDADAFQLPAPPTRAPPTRAPPTRPLPMPTPTGKIKGIMFKDTNGNGDFDTGESDIKDVDVVITDSSGESQMVTTDSNGEYTSNVPAGPAIIEIDETTLPSRAVQTLESNLTEVDVPAGGMAIDEDGFQLTGKVKGTMFEDRNGNGRKEPNKPGIAGVDIVITDSTGKSQTVITDNSSMYMATVSVGPTAIEIDENALPPGAEQTAGENPLTVDVSPSETVTDEDGFQPQHHLLEHHLLDTYQATANQATTYQATAYQATTYQATAYANSNWQDQRHHV